MSGTPRIAAKCVPDNTLPETGLNALAAIYRRAVERYEEANAKEKGGPDTAPDDGTTIKGDSAYERSIP